MILGNVFDHYRQHLSRMVKRSTREDYNKRLAMLSKFCAMHSISAIEDIDFTQFLEWVFIGLGVASRKYFQVNYVAKAAYKEGSLMIDDFPVTGGTKITWKHGFGAPGFNLAEYASDGTRKANNGSAR